jgi:hypothetical protein
MSRGLEHHDQPWTRGHDDVVLQEMRGARDKGERVYGYHSKTAKELAKRLGRSLAGVQTRFAMLSCCTCHEETR